MINNRNKIMMNTNRNSGTKKITEATSSSMNPPLTISLPTMTNDTTAGTATVEGTEKASLFEAGGGGHFSLNLSDNNDTGAFDATTSETTCNSYYGNLWQGRRFRILLSSDTTSAISPIWHICTVTKIVGTQFVHDDQYLEMQFETPSRQRVTLGDTNDATNTNLKIGDYVEINGLVKASNYNGSYGIIISDQDFAETGRYEVQARDVSTAPASTQTTQARATTKNIRIKSKHLSIITSERTWKISRLHPFSGGTLVGTLRDCANLVSFEWLDPSEYDTWDEAPILGGNLPEPEAESFIEDHQPWIGTSGYLTLPDDFHRIRMNDEHSVEKGGLKFRSFVHVNASINTNAASNNDSKNIVDRCPATSLVRKDYLPKPSRKMLPKNEEGLQWLIPTYTRLIQDGIFTAEWTEYSNLGCPILLVSFYTNNDHTSTNNVDEQPRDSLYLATITFTEWDGVAETFQKLESDIEHVNATNDGLSGITVCEQLKHVMTQDQQQYMCVRLLHWLIREEPLLLNGLKHISPLKVLREVFDLYKCLKKHAQHEALAIKIIEADWTYHTKTQTVGLTDAAISCNDIGELLESMGRFTLAAEVYSEAANHFKREKPTLDLNGGLAFKRGELYDKAEHQYIKCLSMGHNKDKNELLFNNIILNYEHWLNQDIGNNEISSLLIGFSALLFSAGYTMQCIKMWGQQRRKILKKKFLLKSNALNHVNHIMTFNSDSVQEFRSAIFTCMKQNRNFKAGILIPDSRSEKEKKAVDKNAAKKTLRMYNEAVTVKCDNCGIMGAEFKQCPCLLVAYCGRDCQLKQWSTHKKVCPIARK